MSFKVVIVVPLFNEVKRFDYGYFESLLGLKRDLSLLFVDDGSTDDTGVLVADFSSQNPERATLMRLPKNVGKAEAVRLGLAQAQSLCNQGEESLVGFIDADGAVSAEDIEALLAAAETRSEFDWFWGSRVGLAGRRIERSMTRHWISRTVNTLIGLRERNLPYDTQCGAKFFRASPLLSHALHAPFVTRWLFEVELIQRCRVQIARGDCRIWEVPIANWVEVPGSRIRGMREFTRIAHELMRICLPIHQRRADRNLGHQRAKTD